MEIVKGGDTPCENPTKIQLSWNDGKGEASEWYVLEAVKDNAYSERNKLLALVCKMAVAMDYDVQLWRHSAEDKTWENDWRNIVAIHLPTGQCTWHIHDSELHMFDWLPRGEENWDGHTTEEKYQRVAEFNPLDPLIAPVDRSIFLDSWLCFLPCYRKYRGGTWRKVMHKYITGNPVFWTNEVLDKQFIILETEKYGTKD